MKLCNSIIGIVISLYFSTTNAAIITKSNSIIDDNTNLEWLNLNETAYISYNSLLAQVTAGDFENFRVATYNEIYGLADSYSLLDGAVKVGVTLYDNWANIDPSPYNGSPFDIILSSPEAGNPNYNKSLVFRSGAFYSGNITYAVDQSYPDMAVALVREVSAVPITAAAWLFGSGLIGLLGVTKQRKGSTPFPRTV